MTPDALFQLANPLALLGWLALLATPLAHRAAQAISAAAIPLLLSLAYAGLVLAFWWEAPGGHGAAVGCPGSCADLCPDSSHCGHHVQRGPGIWWARQ